MPAEKRKLGSIVFAAISLPVPEILGLLNDVSELGNLLLWSLDGWRFYVVMVVVNVLCSYCNC